MNPNFDLIRGARASSIEVSTEKQSLGDFQAVMNNIIHAVNQTNLTLPEIFSHLQQFEVSINDFRPDHEQPLNKIALFLAHNAYNVTKTGLTSILPNQSLSYSEMLEQGVRAFELDVHEVNKEHLLCHAVCNANLGSTFGKVLDVFFGTNKKLIDAVLELESFTHSNPDEVIIVKLEDHLATPGGEGLANLLTNTLGKEKIFTGTEFAQFIKEHNGVWPSLAEIASMGKNLIFTTENLSNPNPLFVNTPHNDAASLIAYNSVLQAVESDFKNLAGSKSQLVEIGEDQTPIIGDFRSLWGRLPWVKGAGGGKFTKEQIDQLRANVKEQGVMIDLDKISKNDRRINSLQTISGLLVSIKENSHIFVPAAILGGVLSAVIQPKNDKKTVKSFLSKNTSLAIKLLLYATLPPAGKFLYATTQGTVTAYQEDNIKELQEQTKKVDESIIKKWGNRLLRGVGCALDETARCLLTKAVQDIRHSCGMTFDDKTELVTNIVMDNMIANTIVTGAENALKSIYNRVRSFW